MKKKNKVLIVCAGLLCAALLFIIIYFAASGEDPDNLNETNNTVSASDPTDAVMPNDTEEPANYQLNDFDKALIDYLSLNGYDSTDFIISPAAFRSVICLSAAGARGNTRTELVSAAGFSGINALDTWYSSLKKSETSFSVSNSIWNNKDMLGDFTKSYISNVKEKYHAEAYSYGSNALTQAINDWFAVKTGSMLTEDEGDFAGASSVLLCTLQLGTAWKNTFQESTTAGFMEQTGEFLYAEDNGTQIIVVPLEGNMSFICFLGNRIDRFDKMADLQTETVHLVLPKFELESVFDSKDLLGFLLTRGVHDAIDGRIANFYNMCQGTDWFIQEIVQKVGISVDENGIGQNMADSWADDKTNSEDNVKEFFADSPFSFAVFSDFGSRNQQMLFYGQLMNSDE